MIRCFALLLPLLVLTPQSTNATLLRPGEIGVFYDQAATQRVGSIYFAPFYVCARLDAAGLSAAKYSVEVWNTQGSSSIIANVDLQITDPVVNAHGVVILGTHFYFGSDYYARIVPYGGTAPFPEITSAASGASPRPMNWRSPHWRGDISRTVPGNAPLPAGWQVASVIATHGGADAGDVATVGAYLVYFGIRAGDYDPYDDDFDPDYAGRDIWEVCNSDEAVCCSCYPQDWVQTRFEWDPTVASYAGVRAGVDQPNAVVTVLDQGPGFVVARIDDPGELYFHNQTFQLDLLLDGVPTMTEVALTSTSSGLFGDGSFIAEAPLGSRRPGKVFVDCEFHDIVDDDVIDVLDVRASLDLMLSEEPIADAVLCRSDIDFDGELEPGDAVRTARAAAGLGTAQPSGVAGNLVMSLAGATLLFDTSDIAGYRASVSTSLAPGTALVVTSPTGEASAHVTANGQLEIVFAQVDTAPALVEVSVGDASFGLPQLVGVTAYDASGKEIATTSSTTSAPVVTRAALSVGRAFPNPFNPRVTIPYTAHRPVQMRVRILDAKGRHVLDLEERAVEAGTGSIVWDGQDAMGGRVASGVYRVCFVTEEGEMVERVTLLK